MKRLSPEQRRAAERLLPIAERLARRYVRARAGCELAELLGPANEALVEAVRTHDTAKGPIEPWVILKVRGALIDQLRGRARRVRREVVAVSAAFCAGELAEAGADGAPATLAEFLDAPSPREQALAAVRARVAEVVLRLGARRAPEGPSVEDDLAQRQLDAKRAEAVRRVVSELPDEERRVAQGLYYDERTSVDVAAELGCTDRHLRRIHARMRERLAERLRDSLGSSDLGERAAGDAERVG